MTTVTITVEQRKREKAVPVIDWTALAKRMATDNRAENQRSKLAATLGVSVEALEALWVGVGYDRESYWSFPERDPSGRVVGIVRRYADGRKKTMQHGHHGLYYSAMWWNMPGPVYLPEGASDTAALLTLGISVIGRPSNLGGVKHLAAMLRGRNKEIVVVGENDEHPERRGVREHCPALCQGCGLCWPGKFGAVEVAARLSAALRREVRWCLPPFAKDARDWLNRNPEASAVDWLAATRV